MKFTIFPAIDLRNGHVVRLKYGDPNQQTTFSHDPVAMGERWLSTGADWLHIVNLDGAFDEAGSANWAVLPKLANLPCNLQFGGGIRTLGDVEKALGAGVDRVILGTVAIENPEMVKTAYAQLGAEWLFEQIGGAGKVVEMRGIDGVPADTDRHNGFLAALENYPDIEVVAETFTGWDPSTGAQQALDLITTQEINGIWTSGIDYTVVEQFEAANVDYVPVVGADNNGFVERLLNLKDQVLRGCPHL